MWRRGPWVRALVVGAGTLIALQTDAAPAPPATDTSASVTVVAEGPSDGGLDPSGAEPDRLGPSWPGTTAWSAVPAPSVSVPLPGAGSNSDNGTGTGSGSSMPAAGRHAAAMAGDYRKVTVPDVLWAAYRHAAGTTPAECHLPVELLAAIGEVESGSLAGHRLDESHRPVPAVLGPALDGRGHAAIPDTDGGRWDGDPTWDRAVGPMQFIPGTWRVWGRDGDGDGAADPQDLYDATVTAAAYLCAAGGDLSRDDRLETAVLAYNHSRTYLTTVLALMHGLSGTAGTTATAAGPVVTVTVTAPPGPGRTVTQTQTVADTVTVSAGPPSLTPTTPPVTRVVTTTQVVTITATQVEVVTETVTATTTPTTGPSNTSPTSASSTATGTVSTARTGTPIPGAAP